MSTGNGQTKTPAPRMTETPPTPTASGWWRLVIAGLGAILTFAGVIGLSLPLKALITTGVLLLWGVSEIIIKFKKDKIEKQAPNKDNESKETASQTIVLDRRSLEVRWTAGGIIAVILLAAGFKELELRLTPLPPPPSKSIYSMIVLDASEEMKLPFEGSSSKWSAVQSSFQDYFERANELSNYGLTVIGGQNSNEKGAGACGAPTVPLIPLVFDDGHGNMLIPKDLSLASLRTEIESQQPQGGGSLSRAFFLAKNQLENLPVGTDATRIIVLVASTRDICEGDIDWDDLIQDIQLVSKEIAIHKELILLDENPPPELEKIVTEVGPADQPLEDPGFNIYVAKSFDELTKIVLDLMDRLNTYTIPAQLAETTASSNTNTSVSPSLHVAEIVTRAKMRTGPTAMPNLVTIIPTTTCTPTFMSTVTEVPFASTAREEVPASTFSFTPSLTYTPTLTFTPTITAYPTIRPTKKIIRTVVPAPTNPPPTKDPCCMHCTSISKPCGDICIPLDHNCTAPKGCACKP